MCALTIVSSGAACTVLGRAPNGLQQDLWLTAEDLAAADRGAKYAAPTRGVTPFRGAEPITDAMAKATRASTGESDRILRDALGRINKAEYQVQRWRESEGAALVCLPTPAHNK